MKIAFWNTKLMKAAQKHPEYQAQIINAITSMMSHDDPNRHDIIFLCEVDSDFYSSEEIIRIFDEQNLSISAAVSPECQFDLCSIYRKDNVNVEFKNLLIFNDLDDGKERTGNNIKVGAKYLIKNTDNTPEFYVIASHWTSKCSMGYEFRHKDAAEELRKETKVIVREGHQVVLIGDYNRSPSEIIDDTNLKSYNNKYYVLRNSERLYNLSFNFTSQHTECGIASQTNDAPHGFGTFISSSSRATEHGCAVFDHVHVSSNFISDGPWIVNELETKIIFNQNIMDLIYAKTRILDHLPISVEVNKNEQPIQQCG